MIFTDLMFLDCHLMKSEQYIEICALVICYHAYIPGGT